MSGSDPIHVALFPIPNVVAFPGTVLPLHVFEPRYRRLVHDCVRDGRMVGVSHVRKTIHEPAGRQTLEEALQSNQATYQPRDVFSAGYCEVKETSPDGRIMAEILMTRRLVLVDEVQLLPYRIVACASVEDDEPGDDRAATAELQRLIYRKTVELVRVQNPVLARDFEHAAWNALDPAEFSFRIFQVLHFDAEILQALLETRSVHGRLESVWNLIRRI